MTFRKNGKMSAVTFVVANKYEKKKTNFKCHKMFLLGSKKVVLNDLLMRKRNESNEKMMVFIVVFCCQVSC